MPCSAPITSAAAIRADSRDIDVHGLHQGYLRALKARGGVIVTDAEVEAIERSGRDWSVRTRAGDFAGAHLVNAAGAWADEIARKAGAQSVGLIPKRRTAFTINAPAGAAIADWPLVNDVGAAFYFKPDAGQLLVSPADAVPSPPTDAQADEYELALGIDRLERATSIPVRKINRKWAGLRTSPATAIRWSGGSLHPPVSGSPARRLCASRTAPALSRIIAGLILTGALPAAATARGLTAEEMSLGRFSALVEPSN